MTEDFQKTISTVPYTCLTLSFVRRPNHFKKLQAVLNGTLTPLPLQPTQKEGRKEKQLLRLFIISCPVSFLLLACTCSDIKRCCWLHPHCFFPSSSILVFVCLLGTLEK